MSIEVIDKDMPVEIIINKIKEHKGTCAVTGKCWYLLITNGEFETLFQPSEDRPTFKNHYYMGQLNDCRIHILTPQIGMEAAFEKYSDVFCLLL